jgi:CHAT domain-containing protein/tetratricopeptide (TPR) repeat protein
MGGALSKLAGLYQAQGRFTEAEPLHLRSLAIYEKALGPDHEAVGQALDGLAMLYQTQGRYAEAEPLYKRGLGIIEKAVGADHIAVGQALNNLATLYQTQRRDAEAAPLLRRSFDIAVKTLGPDNPILGRSLNNLAGVYRAIGRYTDAESLLKRSLAIYEKAFGPDHPDVAHSLDSLAALYQAQGRFAEAEPIIRRSLAILEKALGAEHPKFAVGLSRLGQLYLAQTRIAEAEALFDRSFAISEKALGPEHPEPGGCLNCLAAAATARGDWARATHHWRRGTDIIKRRAQRGLTGAPEGAAKGEVQRWSGEFEGLIRVAHRLSAQSPAAAVEMFDIAQWAQGSDAAASLAQMAARSATGSPVLAGFVRERQDLAGEWQAKDKLLIAAKSQEPGRRDAGAEKGLGDRLAAIDARLVEINGRLANDFPDYVALASPAPVSVAEVQAQLGSGEALVLFLDTSEWKVPGANALPEETFAWVVTKSEVRWLRSELGTVALKREVAALRCGLDATAWHGEGAPRCADLLKLPSGKVPQDGQPLPFDAARAHALYVALLGGARDLIKAKHLLVVPSGALTTLPFQVLVTEPPSEGVRPGAPAMAGADARAQPSVAGAKVDKAKGKGPAMRSGPQGPTPQVRWLVRDHAVTVLPAVSSLKALRRVGRASAAPRPLIGFGNPLLDGPDSRYAHLAKLAREKQRCPVEAPVRVAVVGAPRSGVVRIETRGLASLPQIRIQAPLPETADELCAVAHNVKAQPHDIRLGAQASEREVRRLSASGDLAKYRILHFATHGVLAGELDGAHEPGLILTPPESASEEDDGYLSASEVASLKLDADWVVLSACNTAAGASANAEALSGLGRAFIYAGARALLVSHWAVDSDATVKLVTGTVAAMAGDATVGRAEALRRAMLTLIDKGGSEAHPAYWAPFVVVGEGAAQ